MATITLMTTTMSRVMPLPDARGDGRLDEESALLARSEGSGRGGEMAAGEMAMT